MRIKDLILGMKISLMKIRTYNIDDPSNLLKEGECVIGILDCEIKEKEPIKIKETSISKDIVTSNVIKIYEENDVIFIDTVNSTFKIESLD